MAMTADGKIATANRAVSSFGSARDREHLLELRATADERDSYKFCGVPAGNVTIAAQLSHSAGQTLVMLLKAGAIVRRDLTVP